MKTELTAATLAKYFDQTLLKPYVSDADFKAFCEESARYHFKMIAINSAPVAKCKAYLKDSDVLVGAAIGFPLGQTTIADKVFETKQAIADGADEIDYVHNIVELKSGNLAYVEREMREIVEVCRAAGKTSKVIFENCYLTDDEKKILCEIALKVKPDFIKTSTGFSKAGATFHDVELFAQNVGPCVKIKAAGGISSLEDAEKFIQLGASRLGTSRIVKLAKAMEA